VSGCWKNLFGIEIQLPVYPQYFANSCDEKSSTFSAICPDDIILRGFFEAEEEKKPLVFNLTFHHLDIFYVFVYRE